MGSLLVCGTEVVINVTLPLQTDVMLSYLPLAHMLERCCEVAVYIAGGAVGFYGGDIKNLAEDYKALRPTITPSVPRLLNRVYDKVTGQLNGSSFKKFLFNMGLASKRKDLERFEKLIMAEFKALLNIYTFVNI